MPPSRRTGFEVELLAPPGSDRAVLAGDLARRCGGTVRRVFVTGSEPSAVPGTGVFWHLAPGFEVGDGRGAPVATLVDDVTLVADLPVGGPSHPRWYRVLSDDLRLLRLVAAHADPDADREHVLDGVAALFGTTAQAFPAAVRLSDTAGATVALAAPLPAGRERPCEVVTAPLAGDRASHATALEALLAPARELGFTVPLEAAVHLHVDAARFRDSRAFTDLVRLFSHWRSVLRAGLETNPACTRLAPLPAALVALADRPASRGTAWPDLQRAARATGPVKFCDLNITALMGEAPVRDTVEVRVLGGSDDGQLIAERAHLVHDLLERCGRGSPLPAPAPDVAERAATGSLDPAAARAALHELAASAP